MKAAVELKTKQVDSLIYQLDAIEKEMGEKRRELKVNSMKNAQIDEKSIKTDGIISKNIDAMREISELKIQIEQTRVDKFCQNSKEYRYLIEEVKIDSL